MTDLPEEHSFDQIKVGDITSFTDEITKSRLESFAELIWRLQSIAYERKLCKKY